MKRPKNATVINNTSPPTIGHTSYTPNCPKEFECPKEIDGCLEIVLRDLSDRVDELEVLVEGLTDRLWKLDKAFYKHEEKICDHNG